MALAGSTVAASVKQTLESKYACGSSLKRAREARRRRVINALADETDAEQRALALAELQRRESEHLRSRRASQRLSDFEQLDVIGQGAFGEVRVCREVRTGKTFALKKLRVADMVRRWHVGHVHRELEVMERMVSEEVEWTVKLHSAFQEAEHVVIVMEYVPGGDLMGLLIARHRLDERAAQFYAAEITAALESIHALGIAHRDVKPDNVLIGRDGHIKLADFGLAKTVASSLRYHTPSDEPLTRRQHPATQREAAWSVVGTPDYMAPEVLLRQSCGYECDWWSLGAVLYEMLLGFAPFGSDSADATAERVLRFRHTLHFPADRPISLAAHALVCALLTDRDARLGSAHGAADLRAHPFFAEVQWQSLRSLPRSEVPFVPAVNSETDTSYFEGAVHQDLPSDCEHSETPRRSRAGSLPFVGFHYREFSVLGLHSERHSA